MHRRFPSLATLSLLAACTATSAQPPQRDSNENLSLQDQIERNWNIPTPLECRREVRMRIHLAPDGTVTGTEPLEPMAAGDPCQVIVDSLRRAALISSPLWFPPGQKPESVTVRFDPENFRAYF